MYGRLHVFCQWIAALQEELNRADAGSKLGNYRLKIIRSDIDMLPQSMSADTRRWFESVPYATHPAIKWTIERRDTGL